MTEWWRLVEAAGDGCLVPAAEDMKGSDWIATGNSMGGKKGRWLDHQERIRPITLKSSSLGGERFAWGLADSRGG